MLLFIKFCSVSVDEVSRNISLTVVRDLGTFGDVSVFFYAQSTVEGTNLGLDYKISPQVYLYACTFFLMTGSHIMLG